MSSLSALFITISKRLLCVSTVILIVIACENEIDTSPNILPTLESAESDLDLSSESDMTTSSGCSTCAEVGTWYRFTKLELETVDNGPHPVIQVLNSLWTADVDSHALNVLFQVRSVEGNQITMGAMNAAWVSEAEDDYCVLPDTAIEFIFTQNDCSMANDISAGINIFAGSQEIPKNCSSGGEAKNAIPVRDVMLEVDFSTDCSELINGTVRSAAIKKTALEQTCSCLSPVIASCQGLDPNFEGNNFDECAGCNQRYSSLSRQLNSIQPLTWECNIEGEQAVCIEASFAATRLSFTPSNCP